MSGKFRALCGARVAHFVTAFWASANWGGARVSCFPHQLPAPLREDSVSPLSEEDSDNFTRFGPAQEAHKRSLHTRFRPPFFESISD